MNEEVDLGKALVGFYLRGEDEDELTHTRLIYGVEMRNVSIYGLACTMSDDGNICFITKELEANLRELEANLREILALTSRGVASLEEDFLHEEKEGGLADPITYLIQNLEKSENLKGFLCVEASNVEVLASIKSELLIVINLTRIQRN